MRRADDATSANTQGGAPEQLAHMLSAWWTRPEPASIALWTSPTYARQIKAIWLANVSQSSLTSIDKLLATVIAERDQLAAEYERLFVGPAIVPCPPYEVMWRADRPKHEQGMVVGQSTDEVKRLYRDLGLRVRSDGVELPDHIAIELEALAYACAVGAEPGLIEALLGRLETWLPAFCTSVAANSQIEFYRAIPNLTLESLVAIRGLLLHANEQVGAAANDRVKKIPEGAN